MKDIEKILVAPTDSIRKTIEVIDASTLQIALVVDENRRLLGTVTDGDIRRGILRGLLLEEPVCQLMNSKPTVARNDDSRESILAVMKQKRLRHIPILSEDGRVIRLELLEQMIKPPERDNWVIVMAGGLGSRLAPLTDDCPKPLLRVGNKPVLETVLENFIDHGFRRFYLSVNYRAEMIEAFFGDGSRWGVEIRYVYEDKRMGTAGALSLLPEKPDKPIIVMNGDLLTKVNFQQLLEFHVDHHVSATMCVREYDLQIPYGVVRIEDQRLLEIQEKPIQRYFVNAGVYVLEPSALDLIPQDSFFDMPSLFSKLTDQQKETIVFPIREYWMDIGRLDDFERANAEYSKVFK